MLKTSNHIICCKKSLQTRYMVYEIFIKENVSKDCVFKQSFIMEITKIRLSQYILVLISAGNAIYSIHM